MKIHTNEDPSLTQSLQPRKINNSSSLTTKRKSSSQPDGVLNPIVYVPMRKSKVRFVTLAMASLLMFGNNYSFDNPQALQKQIMVDVGVSSPQYNLLYSAFSFPNIFLTLAGGIIVDFLGVRAGNILFCSLVAVSQTVVAIGGSMKIFWLMLAGRAMFGICSENLIIAQAAIVAKWFKGKELSTAIGCIMTVPEISSAANSLLSPMIYELTGSLTYPLFFSVIICLFSLACAVVLVIIDKRADLEQEALGKEEDEEDGSDSGGGGGGHGEKVSFNDIKQLSSTFWILLLVCMTVLGVYIPFLDDANDFYQEKFKFSAVQAGQVLTVPYLVSAITSPFIGPQVDKIGKRRLLIIVTTCFFILSQFLLGYMAPGQEEEIGEEKVLTPNWLSIIPLALLGLSFALYSCVVIPSVQYVVEQRIMGTAFGLMGMLESIALAFFPIIAATIVESSDSKEVGYSNVGYFFCGIAILAFILAISLYFLDQKGSLILDFVNPEEPNEQEELLLKKYESDSSSSESESESDSEEEEEEADEEMKEASEIKSGSMNITSEINTQYK